MAAKKKTSKPPVKKKTSKPPVEKKTSKPPVDITKIKGVTSGTKSKPATVGPVKPGGTKMPTANKGADKGAFAGSGTPLGTSLAGSKLSKGNIASAAVTAVSGGTLGRGISMLRVVRDAPKIAKKYQRQLSSEMKSDSTKGMSKAQKQAAGERKSELLPSESSRLTQYDLRKQVSEAMKTNKGKLKIKRR